MPSPHIQSKGKRVNTNLYTIQDRLFVNLQIAQTYGQTLIELSQAKNVINGIHEYSEERNILSPTSSISYTGQLTFSDSSEVNYKLHFKTRYLENEITLATLSYYPLFPFPDDILQEYVGHIIKHLRDRSIENVMYQYGRDILSTDHPVWCKDPLRFEINQKPPITLNETCNSLIKYASQFALQERKLINLITSIHNIKFEHTQQQLPTFYQNVSEILRGK